MDYFLTPKSFSRETNIPIERVERLVQAGILPMRGGFIDVGAWLKRKGEDKETRKRRLIKEYQNAHPGVSLRDAVLEVSRQHPQLFRQ
jgi:hypothetical protein